jgi:hypothetical protein
MKTSLLSVALFAAVLSSYAYADWPTSIHCSADAVDVTITLPSGLSSGNMVMGASLTATLSGSALPDAPTVITQVDSQVLDIMSQTGYACVINRASGFEGSACGFVATGTQTAVNCR